MNDRSFEAGLRAWAGAAVERVTRPSTGYSNETAIVDLEDGRRLVLRLPPGNGGLFPYYDLDLQAAVLTFVASHGIPVPQPVTLVEDPGWLGRPFLVMPFIEGHVLGEAPSIDPWLAEAGPAAQGTLHDRFVDLLAQVHCLEGRDPALRHHLGNGGGLPDELERWQRYLAWVAGDDPVPSVLAEGLTWCRARLPGGIPPPSLLWGDVRLGNLIVGMEGGEPVIRALLDWEMAGVGPAEGDLAWYLALDAVTGRIVGRPPGFPDRREVVSRYEERLGRRTLDLDWHETFALVRALAISWRQLRLEALRRGRPASALDDRHPVALALSERLAEG